MTAHGVHERGPARSGARRAAIARSERYACVMLRAALLACGVWLMALLESTAVVPRPAQHTARGAHVLFLMVDQMDGRVFDDTSPLHEIASMPHLCRLKSQGASFTSTYVTSPQCVPSRTTMAVGRRNHQIQVWDNSRGIVAVDGDPENLDHVCVAVYGREACAEWAAEQKAPPTFIDVLNRSGINVTLYGKLHIGAGLDRYSPPGETNAFPFWGTPSTDPEKGWPIPGKQAPGQPASGDISHTVRAGRYWTRPALLARNVSGHNVTKTLTVPDDIAAPLVPTDYLTIDLCKGVLERGRLAVQAPQSFLYCSILVPHPPYLTNATYMALINDSLSDASLPKWNPLSEQHPADYLMMLYKGDAGMDWVSVETRLHFRRVYFSRCAAADAMIGQVLSTFEQHGDVDNTYTMFIADHGEDNTEHRMTGKNTMYEAAARVPMILTGPGIVPGTLVTHLASLFDVYPTVLDLMGLSDKNPANLVGSSVLPLAQKRTSPGRKDYVVSEYHSFYSPTGIFMIRHGDYKLIQFGSDKVFGSQFPEQLFYLKDDPHELQNIALANPKIVASLKSLLAQEVDVEEADKMCKAYNLQQFERYFYTPYGGAEHCVEALSLLYEDFNPVTDAHRITKWSGLPCH